MTYNHDKTDHELMLTWVSLVHAGTWLPAQLDEKLKQTVGISLPEQDLLNQLSKGGGVLKMQELAERLFLSKAGMTKMIDRLEAADLLARERSREDRRVVTANLTARGKARLADSRRVLKRWVVENLGTHLERNEIKALLGLLRKLLSGHDRWAGQLEHITRGR